MADKVNGTINTAAPIEALKIPVTSTMEPKITTTVSFNGNLQADTELGGARSTSKEIYDAEGYAHRLSTMYTKIGDNQWLAYTSITGAKRSASPPTPNVDDLLGNVKIISFDSDGKFQNVQDLTSAAYGIDSLGNFPAPSIDAAGDFPAGYSPFTADISLDAAGSLGQTAKSVIVFRDANGASHTVNVVATCTKGETASSVNDAEWKLDFLENGATVGTGNYSATGNPGNLPTITLSGSTSVNLDNIAQKVNVDAGASALNARIESPFTADINLNANGVLGQTEESVMLFTDYNGAVRAIGVKATCTKGDSTGSAGDAEWQLAFVENGQTVGSGSYSAASILTPGGDNLPTVTLSDGTPVNLNTLAQKVTVDAAASALNTLAITAGGNTSLSYTPANTVNPTPHQINVTYTDPTYGNMSQYAGGFNLGDPYQNGYASGDLQDKTINAAGIIVGTYSNGQQLNLGQIATCVFNNQQGLERAGSTLFTKSNNSGDPIIGEAGTSGRGTLQAGVLEMANVDLAEEFTNMIVTQRGYQSNSRVITTSDEMLQELMSLKR
jgi:flagellar hook protein FlgE